MPTNRKLQHDHLIDGKYLKEDCISNLRTVFDDIIENHIAASLHKKVNLLVDAALEQFEDECVAYDVSCHYIARKV